ncbi:MFS transporter [Streptomyces sp. HG99]|nr:MFS transporter [Streptomyces sp. HG99]
MNRTPTASPPPGGRTAWAAWAVSVSVYFVAVIDRTSLGVAGLDAADRFGIGASALSTFAVLQMLIYACMQIPVGLLVDRFGPRTMLLLGATLLTLGQFGFAFSHSMTPALLSRALLSFGDAMIFVSVLRVVGPWFPARRNPLVAQLTGVVGSIGNLGTAAVLAPLLHSRGWTVTFGGTALLGVAVLLLVGLLLRETPEGARRPARCTAPGPRPRILPQIRTAWGEPGTRLGLWVHFTTGFMAASFAILWGIPYLVEGQGLSREKAAVLLAVLVLASMPCGPLLGQLIARRPGARTHVALTVVLGTGALWAVVLAWPGGHPPLWLLVVLMVAMGANGPASLIGLDYARATNPPERLGTASGIANMGGFLSTTVALLGIGLLLDAASPGGDYTPGTYRWAFCWLYVPMLLGVVMILRLHPRVARRAAEGTSVPVPGHRPAQQGK